MIHFLSIMFGLDQGELEITVIGIMDFGGVTSTFGCYLYSTRKVENTDYSSLISNAHHLKNYILITMNVVIGVYCSRWRTMASREAILFYLHEVLVIFGLTGDCVSDGVCFCDCDIVCRIGVLG